jgi:UPF0755 protein
MQRGGDEMLDDLDLAWEEQQEPRRRGRPQSRQQRRRRRDERKRKGRSYTALIVSLVLLAVLGAGVYWGVGKVQENQSFKEFVAADYDASEAGDEVDFQVPDGAGGTKIATDLLNKGVVKSRTAFVNACDADKTNCESIQPGRYKVKMHSPAKAVLDILIDPKNKLISQVTITEGLSVITTLAKLAEQTGIPLKNFQDAAKDPAALGITADWYTRKQGGPSATASVEGFLFPDTYQYEPGASALDILKMMVKQFLQVTDDIGLKAKAQALNLSPYEVLITASLVQDEGKEADFAKIARVAYNRAIKELIDCACLQFDSTANYWLELNGKPTKNSGDMTIQELDDKANPYNTVSRKGLPIGPISNPGKAALLGAAQPAQGNWIYFVAVDKQGTTKFAATDSEHCQNINEAIRNGLALTPC